MTIVCAFNYFGIHSRVLTLSQGFDMRPFLYPSRFPWQFRKIDEVAEALPDRSSVEPEQKTKTD